MPFSAIHDPSAASGRGEGRSSPVVGGARPQRFRRARASSSDFPVPREPAQVCRTPASRTARLECGMGRTPNPPLKPPSGSQPAAVARRSSSHDWRPGYSPELHSRPKQTSCVISSIQSLETRTFWFKESHFVRGIQRREYRHRNDARPGHQRQLFVRAC
jgi:hypothetical protein